MNSRCILSSNKFSKLLLFKNKRKEWSLIKLRTISNSQSNFQNKASNEEVNSQDQTQKSRSYGLKIFSFALTGFTLGLGYVYANQEKRRQISNTLPQADDLFNYLDVVFGRGNQKESKQKEFDNNVIINNNKLGQQPSSGLPTPNIRIEENAPMKSVIEEIKDVKAKDEPIKSTKKTKKSQAESEVLVNTANHASELERVKSESSVQAVDAEAKKDFDWKNSLKELELQEQASIQALEKKLDEIKNNISSRVTETVQSAKLAISTLDKYRQSLKDALDESNNEETKEKQWEIVTKFYHEQSKSVNEANQNFLSFSTYLVEINDFVKDAMQNKLFKNLKVLSQCQKDILEKQTIIKSEEKILKEATIHANVLRSYTNEQKEARLQFLKELQALQPAGILNNSSEDKLSNGELNNLLIHAHKRVLQLQQQIDRMQLIQNQQIQEALDDQRKQYASLQKQNDHDLRQICQQEFDLEKDNILQEAKNLANQTTNKELGRQAAAHNNHLAQMLKLQQDELQIFYERKMDAERERIRSEFFSKVAFTLGKVRGIENALNARVNLELQANNANQLWLAVQNLNDILTTSTTETDSELAPIKSNIDTIISSAPDNEFVRKLVKSLPSNALNNGIWSEPDLRDRFHRVKNVCSKVALIDERGGSLFKYFLSYVQSFFIMNTTIDKSKLDSVEQLPKLEEIDLTTFNILNYAEYYMENGHVDLAIKLMHQLKGEPSRLAKDWIDDATALLEIKQACQLLTSYISSIYIGTHLK